MATLYTNLTKGLDETPFRPVPEGYLQGKARAVRTQPAVLEPAQNDVLDIAVLPADTVFNPIHAAVLFGAFGAGVTLDIGWKANGAIGLAADPNGLADGLDISAAGSANPFGIKNTVTGFDQPLWKWCGLSEAPAPGSMITLTGTFADAAPDPASIAFYLPLLQGR
ncbi:hypothetical protein [Oceanicaulis sp. MMSF_3324]|uniref:hypothetical protein n=1 Tax=Oceanicaulis sp. MMSF_3324 TaxID=3046702 RepID=UPI00273F6BFE|nr:hypothetical protein [Oceanicaulis sp. MMSF_3324]